MRYLIIKRNDGTAYAQRIPDSATDKHLTISEEILIELAERIETLKKKIYECRFETDKIGILCKPERGKG